MPNFEIEIQDFIEQECAEHDLIVDILNKSKQVNPNGFNPLKTILESWFIYQMNTLINYFKKNRKLKTKKKTWEKQLSTNVCNARI